MASATATITAARIPSPPAATAPRRPPLAATGGFLPNPPLKLPSPSAAGRPAKPRRLVSVQASSPSSRKEQVVAGLKAAAALAAAVAIPEMAEAAQPGISPSLKNFLLSIVSGGVVLGVLLGAVIGVANFDPVKRS